LPEACLLIPLRRVSALSSAAMAVRALFAASIATAATASPSQVAFPAASGAETSLRGSRTTPVADGANASSSADLHLGAAVSVGTVARPGCVRVEEFVVSNQCDKSIVLQGWDQVVGPGQTTSVTAARSSDLQRVSWRFQDGPWAHDYIELNGDWAAAGTDFCAHPNYATWYGFTTSSRYEALDVSTGKLACADAGAEVTFSTASCPAGYGPSGALLCDFHATQASIRGCGSVPAQYQEAHTFAINGDGSRTHRFSCPEGAGGEWCGSWVNYPCAPESSDWPGYGVGSWIDCTNQQKSIVFKLTTCI